LFRQYFNIGHGRARNFLKHRKNAKLRHLVLAAVAPALCLAALTPISVIFLVPTLAWCSVCVGCGIILGGRRADWCAMAAGFAAMAMQAGWSLGFFRGLVAELLQYGPRQDPRCSARVGRHSAR
jgi:succinoglycan biosynthesis protein ExoA